MVILNETHDPSLVSWLESANLPSTDFPIQNLPFSIFRKRESKELFRGGVAIGDQIIDLAALNAAGIYVGVAAKALAATSESSLNIFMAMGEVYWSALRLELSRSLREGSKDKTTISNYLIAQVDAEYAIPATIGDYTDFYASIYHATNVGRLFRPDNPLLPNYKWIPIGYHGRSSSINVSGVDFFRPSSQTIESNAETPTYGPCKRLDYELEVGIFIGKGNEQGERILIDEAESNVFGLCVLNDWSARDIQTWEYQPLGPFLSKSFASTISPWIVTMESLAPYRTNWIRDEADPQPLHYLESENNREYGGVDLQLEVLLETTKMRKNLTPPVQLCLTNFNYSYWTVAQMVTHHSVNGCNLRAGDFFGSGTMSGPHKGSEGALIELTKGGIEPVDLGNGESRTYLEDGDRIIMRAWCEKTGLRRIGLGELSSTILPAKLDYFG
ncbi:fumarylacetoacetase [Marinomonas ushuaiensis DSM 15871]|uniref:fumarylacetoacetase n=1 Tax=Marinomonas ushuaiensis DSM 15871 TaxID=1122207 RepID=X7EAG5_9GAMM|nr:fumarylacetoacetase [Marinomonas ushuaiensis]ETX12123.1 fumarylacetoacetase [Marinomonas ushuaiensis DSM 15871]